MGIPLWAAVLGEAVEEFVVFAEEFVVFAGDFVVALVVGVGAVAKVWKENVVFGKQESFYFQLVVFLSLKNVLE